MKKVHINSVGCTENVIDGAIIKKVAESAEYTFIKDPKDADIIIFNTCAYKRKQEDMCINQIRKYLHIKSKNARLIVCGCLVMINSERLSLIYKGLTVAPTNMSSFYEIFGAPKDDKIREVSFITRDISDSEMFGIRKYIERIYNFKRWVKEKIKINLLPNFDLLEYIGDENTWYVRIARGCPNKCGYCAVRFAQGPIKSQPKDIIIQKVKEGIQKGYKKIFIVATNSSAYGIDINSNFLDLLEEIININGDFKIMIHNYEPFGMLQDTERFLSVFSSKKLHSFYCPINSGSKNILKRMNREYDIDEIIHILKKLRAQNNTVLIRTEFITGYPGERWADFVDTVRTIRSFYFNQIDLHVFSPRPNTPASKLDHQIKFPAKYFRHFILWILVFFRVWVRRLRPL